MAAKTERRPHARPTKRFYEDALSEAEKAAFESALQVQGLDEEIALLRVRLHSAIKDGGADLNLMVKGIGLLVKAAAARFKLSPESEEQLEKGLRGALWTMQDVMEGGRDDA